MTATAPAHALALLERRMGSADDPLSPFGRVRSAALDRAEAFPAAACAVLDEAGLARYYVPVRYGGKLHDYTELTAFWRAVARRDLTVAIAHGKTFLGAVCVWVAGTPEQAAELGARVCAGGVIAWGLTERGHGSDLLAGELAAVETAAGWRVSGEKWLINNATRGEAVCLLARTAPAGGPRGFSLLLVDKRRLAPGTFRHLPKERTHGIRGADISGIAFDGAEVPAGALVGGRGQGAEIVLRVLQLTRTACVALSLGAGDHALRLALDFAAARELYGRRLIELPRVRRTLGEQAAGLLLAEVVSTLAARSIQATTGEMSVVSALAKAFVPTTVDEVLAALGELLGARGFLTGAYAEGAFQKLERDHRIVAIFDGSTIVNRNALINQFPVLARAYRAGRADRAGVAAAAALERPLPELDPARLTLLSAGGCSVVQSLPDALVRVRERAARGALPAAPAQLAEALAQAAEALAGELAAHVPSPRDVPPAAFALAVRYELVFAGAACLHVWLNGADAPPAAARPLWDGALWLEACLARVVGALAPAALAGRDVYDRLADVLAAPGARGPLSLWPDPEAAPC